MVEAEAQLLRSAGHEVVELRTQNAQTTWRAGGQLAVSAWNPFAANRVRALIQKYHPDVVHVHNTWFALSPSVLQSARRAGMPVVMTLHNYRLMCSNALLFREGKPCELCVGTSPWPGVRYRCYRGSLPASGVAAFDIAFHQVRRTWQQDVDLFLALNEFGKGRFVAAGLPAHKIRIKPNFVADSGARVASPSSSSALLFVGRLSTEKGILECLDAWQAAWKDRPAMRLLVVGDGPLRARATERGLPGVKFLGRLSPSDVHRHMREARALLVPSLWYEGQPMVLLEALAAGLPILASDLGANGELIEAHGTGWLAASGDRDAWLGGLRRLLDDRAVDAAGDRARRLYEEQFSPKQGLRNLEDAYSAAGATLA